VIEQNVGGHQVRIDIEPGRGLLAVLAGLLLELRHAVQPAEARHAIEQIAVRSQGLERSLPSIVRRLVLGDLPTSVWWTGDLSQTPPLAELATMGRQFVYDSRQWRDVRAGISTVAGLLDHPRAPDLADLNWRRLAPLRQGVSRALAAGRGTAGAGGPTALGAPVLQIRLRHAPGEEALACLMTGWLRSRLERPSGPELGVTVSPEAGPDHRLAISIGDGEAGGITATMSDRQVEVTSPSGPVPFVVAVPMEQEADAVAAELWTLGHDVALIAAVRTAQARSIS